MVDHVLYLDIFTVSKEKVKDYVAYAGMDRGCSLTKVLIFPKNSKPEDDTLTYLHCASFLNSKFEKALEYIKSEATIKESRVINITGIGCEKYKDLIEETLDSKAVFIDEFLSQLKGAMFLVNNFSKDELYFPWINIPKSLEQQKKPIYVDLQQQTRDIEGGEVESKNKSFPAVFGFLGSAAGFVVMHEDGSTAAPEMNIFGGKTFLGLARCLLGTTDYNEITDLASNGKGNLDFCLSDILPTVDTYWNFCDQNPCLYAYGKLSEMEEPEYTKEDLALSLCKAIASALAETATSVCRLNHIKTIYFGGNMARAEIMRICFLQAFSKLNVLDSLEIRFMKTGHTGAIGSLISDPEELKRMFEMIIQQKKEKLDK